MSLLNRPHPGNKPQNRFGSASGAAQKQVSGYFQQQAELPGYQANLLAEELVRQAIAAYVTETAMSAPDVSFTTARQIERLYMRSLQIANELDKEDKLEELLGQLEDADRHGEGNS